MANNLKKIISAVFFFLLISSCTKPYVSHSALEYNKALSKYMNQEILLNAVRASKRRPMSFASVGAFQGTLKNTAGISADLPFVMGTLNNFTLKPSYEGSISDQANFQNLNNSEFYTNLQKEVSIKLFKYYYDNSWPRGLIFFMFFQKATIDYSVYRQFRQAALSKCIKRYGKNWKGHCKTLREIRDYLKSHCRRSYYEDVTGKSRTNKITFFNSGRNRCDYHKFEYFIHGLQLLKFAPKSGEPATKRKRTKEQRFKEPGRGASVMTESQFVSSASVEFKTSDSSVPKALRTLSKKTKSIIHLRSPEAMIYYMGEMIAAQNYLPNGDRFVPTIRIGRNHEKVALFEVVKGLRANSVVSVRDELDGDTFSIPRPDYGAADEARSMNVVTLVTQIIALQTQREDIPKTSSITITAN